MITNTFLLFLPEKNFWRMTFWFFLTFCKEFLTRKYVYRCWNILFADFISLKKALWKVLFIVAIAVCMEKRCWCRAEEDLYLGIDIFSKSFGLGKIDADSILDFFISFENYAPLGWTKNRTIDVDHIKKEFQLKPLETGNPFQCWDRFLNTGKFLKNSIFVRKNSSSSTLGIKV